jgi:nicotinamide phosphoribosyltransferase
MSQVTYNCDAYKISHPDQYYPGTSLVYSNWTPRKSRVEGIDKAVLFGLQYFIKKYLIDDFNHNFFFRDIDKIIEQYVRRIGSYMPGNVEVKTERIKALHDLGYLPLKIKAIPEGCSIPMKVPQVTIENTHPDFFWLVNYFETLMSCTLWKPSTSATTAKEYKKLFDKYAIETVGNTEFTPFQGHDFSMRGMSGLEDAKASGAGHLLSFIGSDTIPAVDFLEEYYHADCTKELIACSVPATEHAVMCSNTGFFIYNNYDGDWSKIGDAEFDTFKRLITEIYPTGIISIVSDTFDLWQVVTKFMIELKEIILARDGKVVIRPDSGDPVDIICGKPILDVTNKVKTPSKFKNDLWKYLSIDESTFFKHKDKYYEGCLQGTGCYVEYGNEELEAVFEEITLEVSDSGVVELLWNVFGGTITEKGYKLLDSHIGVIYGDSITVDRAKQICERLKNKGFASINWVAGIGSYTYQYVTRDTLGFAQKATYCEVMTKDKGLLQIPIFKDPKTDNGTKKSARGLIQVLKDENGEYYYKDQATREEEENSELQIVFLNGKLVKEYTLSEIRENIKK